MKADGRTTLADRRTGTRSSHLPQRPAKSPFADPLSEPPAGTLNMKCLVPSLEEPRLQLQEAGPGKHEQKAPTQSLANEKASRGQLGDSVSAQDDDPEKRSGAKEEIEVACDHRPDHSAEVVHDRAPGVAIVDQPGPRRHIAGRIGDQSQEKKDGQAGEEQAERRIPRSVSLRFVCHQKSIFTNFAKPASTAKPLQKELQSRAQSRK